MTRQQEQCCVAVVVEDEWLIRMELADALTSAGVEVFEAGAAEDALAYLDDDRRVDVLITDIRLLGKMDGWELAEAFRAVRPKIGVIYASANPPQKHREVPDSVFLPKPAPMQRIVQICHAVCDARSSNANGASDRSVP